MGSESVSVEVEVDISSQINFEIVLYLTIMYNIDNKGVNVLMA